MKEKIRSPKVENVAVVVAKERNKENEIVYNVFVVNNSDEILEGVLVSSKGYVKNQETGEMTKTSTLRHFLGIIPPHAAKLVEPIMEELFALNNEYLVSFWKNNRLHDKKYIFLPESIQEKNLVFVPVLGVYGVVIE